MTFDQSPLISPLQVDNSGFAAAFKRAEELLANQTPIHELTDVPDDVKAMLEELADAERHSIELPNALARVACFDLDCESCSRIPMDRKALAAQIRFYYGNSLPPLIRVGDRFLTPFEVEALPREVMLKASRRLPIDFDDEPWKICSRDGCIHWKKDAAGCQRHAQIAHRGVITFDSPYVCTFALPRPKNKDGVPHGPIKRCYFSFATKNLLKKHKEENEHKEKRKASAKKKHSAKGNGSQVIVAPETNEKRQDTANRKRKPTDAPKDAREPKRAKKKEGLLVEDDAGEGITRGKKRTREEGDEESEGLHELDVPRPKKRQRTSTLKETFEAFLAAVYARVERGAITKHSGIVEIVKMIRSKAFVRSDSVEEEAKRLQKRADENEAFEELKKLLDCVEWGENP